MLDLKSQLDTYVRVYVWCVHSANAKIDNGCINSAYNAYIVRTMGQLKQIRRCVLYYNSAV